MIQFFVQKVNLHLQLATSRLQVCLSSGKRARYMEHAQVRLTLQAPERRLVCNLNRQQ